MTDEIVPARTSDFGSPQRLERAAHRIVPRDVTAGGMTLTIGTQILEPTVLDAYARRRMISGREFEAGDLLGRMFRRAIRVARVTQSWGEKTSEGIRRDPAEDVENRRRLWGSLVAAGLAVAGSDGAIQVACRRGVVVEEARAPIRLTDLGNIVISVCGYDERAGGTRCIKRLRKALAMLADLWALPEPDRPAHDGKIRRSRDPDARPTADLIGTDSDGLEWAEERNERRRAREPERRRRRALRLDEEDDCDGEEANAIV